MGKSSNLRKTKQSNVINKQIQDRKCSNIVAFSFAYATTNNKYNLEKLSDEEKAALFDKLKFMTDLGWLRLISLKRSQGFELLPASTVNITPNGLILEKDAKLHSIRFNKQNYRMLAYRPDGCDILHIIGIDYDYSAYSHGS
jgi:hypothetical protein